MTSTPDNTPDIVALLTEQVALYGRLGRLAEKQARLITRGDIKPLMAVLGERKELTARVAELRTRMAPLLGDWDATRRALSEADRGKVDRLVTEADATLHRLIEDDETHARALVARRNTVAAALSGVHAARRAVAAYGEQSAGASATALEQCHALDRMDASS